MGALQLQCQESEKGTDDGRVPVTTERGKYNNFQFALTMIDFVAI